MFLRVGSTSVSSPSTVSHFAIPQYCERCFSILHLWALLWLWSPAARGPKHTLIEQELHPVTSVFLGKVDFFMWKVKKGQFLCCYQQETRAPGWTVTEFKLGTWKFSQSTVFMFIYYLFCRLACWTFQLMWLAFIVTCWSNVEYLV